MKRLPPTILVSRCYSEVTPESAEDGDFSDSGFVHEAVEMTPQELAREIRLGAFHREGCTEGLSTGFHTKCYRTGTEREETLHFDRKNPARLRKHFDRIAAIASAR